MKCHDTTIHEYMVFADDRAANDFAHVQQESADDEGDEEYDGRVFPLYAGHPVE